MRPGARVDDGFVQIGALPFEQKTNLTKKCARR